MKVRPFKASRPARDKAHLVASRSYVLYTKKDLREKLNGNPYSFLHIIHPDLGAKKLHKTEGVSRFHLVRKKYEEFVDQDILHRDAKPMFYIYRQIKNGHPFTGLICTVSVDDYENGKIRIHEDTLSKREAIFTEYLSTTGINAEPVLLISEKSEELEGIFAKYIEYRPEYDFTSTSKVRHQLWNINVADDITQIEKIFEKIPVLYIADGHHRSSSSAALRKLSVRNGTNTTKDHPSNYFLACILDESNVRVYEFNRLVKDLNKLTAEAFLEKLTFSFYVNEAPSFFRPGKKGEFSLYLEKHWYCLTLKHSSPLLDSQLLSDLVLSPLLGIHDLRNDKRVAFLEGPKGMEGLKHSVDTKKFAAAFGLFPVAVSEIKSIADRSESMPPKSTWVEPKLRSGLVVYELNEYP
ncbi:MAG: DUF1015 domain-containing protein [Crocinitomicaceae bacterium]|nr:DUF1015 domain-containing protein [Crocinitomicaceae bacterium]